LTPDDLTLLSDAHVRVALLIGQHLVYVYSASVPVPYVTTHLRTPAQLEQIVAPQSTIIPEGSYFVPETIDVGRMNLTPAKTGLLPAMEHKSELLHFGYVTQWDFLFFFTSCIVYFPSTHSRRHDYPEAVFHVPPFFVG
jgi:hypothetical protein